MAIGCAERTFRGALTVDLNAIDATAARRLDSLVDCYTGHDNSTRGDDFSEFDHQWRVLDLG